MFFQSIIVFLIVLGFGWVMWKYIIAPLLKGHGIDIDDEPEVKTKQTERLKVLKEEFKEKSASAQASTEGLELKKQIDKLEEIIKTTENAIKDGN